MLAELSSSTVVLSNRESYTELMESFRTLGQTAFYLTRLMEGCFCRHKPLHGHFCTGCNHLSCHSRRCCCLSKSYPVSWGVWRDAQSSIWGVTFTQRNAIRHWKLITKRAFISLCLSASCTVLLVSRAVGNYCHQSNAFPTGLIASETKPIKHSEVWSQIKGGLLLCDSVFYSSFNQFQFLLYNFCSCEFLSYLKACSKAI